MDDLKQQLQGALKEAMKNKDAERRNALRLILSAIKQVEVDTQAELDNKDVIAILQKEAKKRRESIEELQKAERDEQVAQEQFELSLLQEFLPAQLSTDDLTAIVQEAIDQTGVSTMKEMGEIMKVVMPQVKGQADGKAVNQIVRELLG